MSALFAPALQPAFAPPPERDLALEGLRGLGALAVFQAYIFIPAAAIDPVWEPSPRFW